MLPEVLEQGWSVLVGGRLDLPVELPVGQGFVGVCLSRDP